MHASDRKAFGRLSAEKAFCLSAAAYNCNHCNHCSPFATIPRQRDSHAESARCQDLQFVTSPVSKWWLRAPASRAGGSAAARHSLSLQPPASASASADGLLGPWRRCRPAAPQRGHHGTAKHGMPKRGGRKPRTGAKSLAVNKRDERHRFCVEPAVCTNRCCSVELFRLEKRRYIKRTINLHLHRRDRD